MRAVLISFRAGRRMRPRPLLLAMAALCHLACWTRSARGSEHDLDASALDAMLRTYVQDLYRVADQERTRGHGPAPAVRLDGIAWDGPGGVWSGSGAVGAKLEDRLRVILGHGATVIGPGESIRSKGLVGDVIRGAVRVAGGALRLTLELADGTSGARLAQVSETIDKKIADRLGAVGVVPPDSAGAAALAILVDRTLSRTPSSFDLRISTARGQFAAYAEGESLTLYLEADVDCFVAVYHIDWSDRRLTRIFPSDPSDDTRLRAGQVRRLPTDHDRFLFEVAPPYGVDAILAVASTNPLVSTGGDEDSRGLQSPEVDVKGVQLTAETLRQAVSKGVLVQRLAAIDSTSDEADPDQDTGVNPTVEEAVTTPSNSGGEHATPDAGLSSGLVPKTARAVCYFTTLKR